ncbi:MAG: class I SAM-dependent methyltransferase [Pseudomonadota bacterium]
MEDPAPRPTLLRALSGLGRVLTDRAARYELLLRHGLLRGGFQSSSETSRNRYPRIFAFVQAQLGADSARRILSFGCAGGDEVFTLRRYFPRAAIRGIDINPGNIAACRRLAPPDDPGLSFEAASSTAGEPANRYDAIFCMAVLRHGSLTLDTPRCTPLLDFADFASTVADFHRCLKPGGLLAIRYSNFRLCDAPAAAGFEPVYRGVAHAPIPLYGPDNALLPESSYRDCVFRKL